MNSTAKTEDAREAINVRFVADRAEWDRLIVLCPNPHLPQGFAYGEGKAAKGWTVRRAVFTRAGTPVAIATVLELRRFGVRLLARVNRGPMLLDPNASDETIAGVYRALRRAWRGPLLVAAALPAGEHSNDLIRRAGFTLRQSRSWRSGRIDITGEEASIWAGFAPTFRNRVRKSDASGATLHVSYDDDAFEWMLERHADNMAEKGFYAVDATFLRAMRAVRPTDMPIFRVIANGEPVAGMTVARFGSHAEYHIGWVGPEGRKVNAGNMLMWGMIRAMRETGVATFDVGGMKEGDGYTQFKQTMNPREYHLAGEWLSMF